MSMVCGLDLHRGQITFDALEVESGEVWRGRVWSPDRARFRRWLVDELALRAHGGPVAVAVEGCTGWRYVVEEITAAGFEAHVAAPNRIRNLILLPSSFMSAPKPRTAPQGRDNLA